MKKALMLLLFLSLATMAQKVAIINTMDDGTPPVAALDLSHLTDRLREIARKTLPQRSYDVMSQQTIQGLYTSNDEMIKACSVAEGCLVKIGREISAEYICQGRIGRFEKDYTIKVELYESLSGNLVDSFTGQSKNISGLLAILNEKAPDMFKRLLGVSGGVVSTPSFAGGFSGVQSTGGGWELNAGKRYLANLTTYPTGAILNFNGRPIASCSQSPCRAELPEGQVHIVAVLDQYESADTMVSVARNNQYINITLKPNFGVLEVKPAYSNGIGKNEQWNLFINDKAISSLENRLAPNKYKVKLTHRCYEDISFEAGINKGEHYTFDMTTNINMAKHIKPKQGGMVLSTERDGEPSSEPVFVNGKQVGETPFTGTVAMCSNVELGREKEKIKVKLEYQEMVKYTHKMPSSQEWLAMMEEQRRRDAETAEDRRRREAAEQRAREYETMKAEAEKAEMQLVKFGWNLALGLTFTPGGSSSELFNTTYEKYNETRKASWGTLASGGIIAAGLTLNIRPANMIALSTELNYNFFSSNYCYGKKCTPDNDSTDYSLWATLYSNTISFPVLLQFGERYGYIFEAGYQFGIPFYSRMWVRGDVSEKRDFSEFRLGMDHAIVLGFGFRGERVSGSGSSIGGRFTYNLSKLDKYGTLNGPFAIAFIINVY